MRILFFFSATVLLITNMICFVGCSRDGIVDDLVEDFDHDLVIADMPIEDIDILISESRPAQVTVAVTGLLVDGCVSHHGTHQSREGNTVNIQMTIGQARGDFFCTLEVREYREEISIGTFAVGEYKLIVNGIERVLRIEDNESWIIMDPRIEYFRILISESRPAQVTLQVDGFLWEECLEFFETRQSRDGDTINIRIAVEIPNGVHCPRSLSDSREQYQEEISIGTFPTGGYKVIVNDIGQEFHID